MREENIKQGMVDWAIALKYDGEGAPVITAKGGGEIAKRIKEIAAENEIPLHQDPDLTALLAQIPLGDEIPVKLYVAVAEVIAFVYSLKQQLQQEGGTPPAVTTKATLLKRKQELENSDLK